MYTVLLVDDEADILNSLKNIIDWPVYGIETVLTACDGVDALQRLDEQPVNLLITDTSDVSSCHHTATFPMPGKLLLWEWRIIC